MKIVKVYSKRLDREVYSIDLRVGTARIRRSGFLTKSEAERTAHALRLKGFAESQGIQPEIFGLMRQRPKPTTVGQVVEAYTTLKFNEMVLRRGEEYARRNSTNHNLLRRWAEFVGVHREVVSITHEDFIEWAAEEQARVIGVSEDGEEETMDVASIIRGFSTICAALNYACGDESPFKDLIGHRPPRKPKSLKSTAVRRRTLSNKEIGALYARLQGPPPPRWRPVRWRDAADFFLVALATGLRIGDILALRWADVDWQHRHLRVRIAKTSAEDFLVHLTPTAARVIAGRKADGLGTATHIFTVRDHTIRDALHNASAAAGIAYGQQVEGGWTVHDLRRTYLTHLLQSGVDSATARDMVGHSCLSVTSKYLHSTTASRRKALGAAEALVRRASK